MVTAGARPRAAVFVLAALLGVAVGTTVAFLAGGDGDTAGPPTAAPAVTQATRPQPFYTVVLASIPSGDGTSRAKADARVAALRGRGIEVEILTSDDYSTLRPGYLVVYSGRFPTEAAAQDHLNELSRTGLPRDQNPYVRQVKAG
jgi:hypothetical protein